MTPAGTPTASDLAGTRIPFVITAPAATVAPVSTIALCRTTDPTPMSARFVIVDPSKVRQVSDDHELTDDRRQLVGRVYHRTILHIGAGADEIWSRSHLSAPLVATRLSVERVSHSR